MTIEGVRGFGKELARLFSVRDTEIVQQFA